jgi:hypothetical protein
MDKADKVDCILENSRLPSKLSGSFFVLEKEIPIVGITGFGNRFSRGEKRSSWFYGEILSPLFIENGGSASKSHIEGIVTDGGELHFLEQVYDFIAHEGDCYEYRLKEKDGSKTLLQFNGEVIARLNRENFKPRPVGKALIEIDPFWQVECGTSVNYTNPYLNRHITCGSYIPNFWNNFLKGIERKGYDHPYMALTKKLKDERNTKIDNIRIIT